MSQNSNNAYTEIRESLPEKRKQIYDAINVIEPCSFYDVADYLSLETNRVSNRFYELATSGYIKVCGTEKRGQYERDLFCIVPDLEAVKQAQSTILSHLLATLEDLDKDLANCETETGKALLQRRITHIQRQISSLKEIA